MNKNGERRMQTLVGAPGTLTIRHTVRAYEVGPSGTAGPSLLANMMQETAGHHATKLGLSMERLAKDNLAWVLSRLRIVLERFPESGEEIDVVTWPSSADKHTATRDFTLYDMSGNVVAKATSGWITFELTDRKMVPLPDFIYEAYPKERPGRAVEFESRVLPKLKQPTAVEAIRSRYSDLDINAHVNNVHFIEWVLEAVNQAGKVGHPNELDIQFRQECPAAADLESRAALDAGQPTRLIHSLMMDSTELVRAVTVWVE